MADLKNVDTKALEKTIREAEERSVSAVRNVAREALECVQEASAAMAQMPRSTSELLTNADVFLVREVDVPAYNTETEVYADVRFSHGNGFSMTGYGEMARPVVKPGRYRVMFVMVALDGKTR